MLTLRYITISLAGTLTIALLSSSALADSKQEDLRGVSEQISALKAVVAKQKKEETQSQQALRELEDDLSNTKKSIRKQNKLIKKQNSQLRSLQKQSTGLSKNLSKEKAILEDQLRAIYFSGKQGSLQFLLNQSQANTIDRMSVYYDYINKARAEKINAISGDLVELNNVQNKVTAQQNKLQKLQSQKNKDALYLSNKTKSRKKLLVQLQDSLKTKEQKLAALIQDRKRLSRLVNSLELIIDDQVGGTLTDLTFSKQKGKLRWPSSGKVKHTFGTIRAGQDLKWQGIFIRNKTGKPVSAVASGQVVYSGWLAGFGQLLILDHKDDYMTRQSKNCRNRTIRWRGTQRTLF